MRTCSICGARAPLCEECLDIFTGQFEGAARLRGYHWGRAVRSVIGGQPWPAYDESPRLQAIARRKVADLTDDERLLERMARAAADEARRVYDGRVFEPGSWFRAR